MDDPCDPWKLPDSRWVRLRQFLRQHSFFLLVQCVAAFCALYWWKWVLLPSPGYSVAVLAVLAAIMSLHQGMKPWQQAIWLLLIGGFLWIEFRAIDKDRTINDVVQANARWEERYSFGELLNQERQMLLRSERLFEATKETIANTRPKAIMGFLGIRPVPIPPVVAVNRSLKFNVFLSNSGNDYATKVIRTAKM